MEETDSVLGLEDPLEEGVATRCSILAWRIPWTEEPGRFTVHVLLKPGLENFEHAFVSVWDECNCAVAHYSQL